MLLPDAGLQKISAKWCPFIHSEAIVDASAALKREDYPGAGPWGINARLIVGDVHKSRTDHPHHLYHDVLVSIDAQSSTNNGLPSLWVRVFD